MSLPQDHTELKAALAKAVELAKDVDEFHLEMPDLHVGAEEARLICTAIKENFKAIDIGHVFITVGGISKEGGAAIITGMPEHLDGLELRATMDDAKDFVFFHTLKRKANIHSVWLHLMDVDDAAYDEIELGTGIEGFKAELKHAIAACTPKEQRLELSGFVVDQAKADIIAQELKNNPALKDVRYITIKSCDIADKPFATIIHALPESLRGLEVVSGMDSFEELPVLGVECGVESCKAFKERLPLLSLLRDFTLRNCKLPAYDFSQFAKYLPRQLSTLDLSQNPIGDASKPLCELLSSLGKLQEFKIRDCGFDDDGLKDIAHVLPRSLLVVDVSKNDLGYPSGLALAKRVSSFDRTPNVLWMPRGEELAQRMAYILEDPKIRQGPPRHPEHSWLDQVHKGIECAVGMLRDRDSAAESRDKWQGFVEYHSPATPPQSTWKNMLGHKKNSLAPKKTGTNDDKSAAL